MSRLNEVLPSYLQSLAFRHLLTQCTPSATLQVPPIF